MRVRAGRGVLVKLVVLLKLVKLCRWVGRMCEAAGACERRQGESARTDWYEVGKLGKQAKPGQCVAGNPGPTRRGRLRTRRTASLGQARRGVTIHIVTSHSHHQCTEPQNTYLTSPGTR